MTALKRSTLALAVCLQFGCAKTRIGGSAPASLEQATLSLGDRQYHLDECRSGDLAYFLGVDLADRSRTARVRLAIDPMSGPRIRVQVEHNQPLVLVSQQCRQLDAEATPTGWQVDTVRDVSGFVDAECTSETGQAVSLHVRFSHCH
jgi:hypothetical protein